MSYFCKTCKHKLDADVSHYIEIISNVQVDCEVFHFLYTISIGGGVGGGGGELRGDQ